MANAPLDWSDIKNSAAKFAIRFKDAKKEESYKQTFWNEFFQMFGIDAIEVGMYEQFVKKYDNHGGEIDYFWPGKLIIEHKSAGKDLDAALNQAMDYILGIEDRKLWPRYIIVSDFKRIRLIDIVDHYDDTILLSDLVNNIEKFGFLAGYNNKRIEGQHPVNVKAAEVMGKLYDLLKESNYPEDDLDTLLIRLVFCMFAEDADIFEKNIFSAYLAFHTNEDGSGMAGALTEIFTVLDTPLDQRQKAMSTELRNFPYVNGGLFSKQIHAPAFDREMRDILFEASRLDWKYISPAIFGSLFQCIMDPELRRELGAHYTSEENILKVINPLFMNDLKHEFEVAKGNKKALKALWDKMSDIRILDPACGCGNFLIISYREMRLLEMDLLKELYGNQMVLDESHLFVDHYYGIEIGEFASMVANLSIILMDHLMNLEMRTRFGQCRDIIPLKEKANIICANSLRIDWKDVINPANLSYIVGNPPFVSYTHQKDHQKEDMLNICVDKSGNQLKMAAKNDYVSAWYYKSCSYIEGTEIKCAFVSTNSICQGEQVSGIWKPLYEMYGISIMFAYPSFVWDNEASDKAHVHVIIVGFSLTKQKKQYIIHPDKILEVDSINFYLKAGPIVFIENRKLPICNVPEMSKGSQPTDDGNLIVLPDCYEEFMSDPIAARFVKRFIGSKEFLNNKKRWCLWLYEADPAMFSKSNLIMERIKKVKEFRLASPKKATQKDASIPYLFTEIRQPTTNYLVLPVTTSGDREYIPIGFEKPDTICSNALMTLPNAGLYHFGVMSSSMHNSWMRVTTGRMKSDYQYSATIVYNNFIWPDPSEDMVKKIEKVAQEILDIRQKYSDLSLAEMYNSLTMPADLLAAHRQLDNLVIKAYNKKSFKDEDEMVSFLFKLYSERVG